MFSKHHIPEYLFLLTVIVMLGSCISGIFFKISWLVWVSVGILLLMIGFFVLLLWLVKKSGKLG